jgi:hypothetical protein
MGDQWSPLSPRPVLQRQSQSEHPAGHPRETQTGSRRPTEVSTRALGTTPFDISVDRSTKPRDLAEADAVPDPKCMGVAHAQGEFYGMGPPYLSPDWRPHTEALVARYWPDLARLAAMGSSAIEGLPTLPMPRGWPSWVGQAVGTGLDSRIRLLMATWPLPTSVPDPPNCEALCQESWTLA